MALKKTAAPIILTAAEKKRVTDFFVLLMEIDKRVNGHKHKKRKATKLSASRDGSQPMRAILNLTISQLQEACYGNSESYRRFIFFQETKGNRQMRIWDLQH